MSLRGRALLFVLLTAASTPAGAEDSLVLTAEADPGVGVARGAVEAQWLHRAGDGHWNAGVVAAEAADARWFLASLGGSRVLTPRWRLAGRLRAGRGKDGERPFDYGLAAVTLTYTLRPGRLYVESEVLAFDVDRSRARLAKVGALTVLGSRASLTGSYTATVAGEGEAEYLAARLDFERAHFAPFFGATVGETVAALLDPSRVAQPAIDYRQIYIGGRFPGPRTTVNLALEYEEVGGVERASIKLGLLLAMDRERS